MAYPVPEARLRSWLEAGLEAHQHGDIDGALAAYRQVLTAAPDHPAALRLFGTGLLQLGQADQAVAYLERAARRQSGDPHLLANLAQAYLALKRYADASRAFRKASRLAPNEVQFHVGVAAALALDGKLDEAEAALARGAARFPDAPLVWCNLGHVFRDTHRPEPALEAYRKALELDPGMVEARNSLGSMLHSMLRFAEAESEYRACIEAAPDFLLPRYNLASLTMDMGRFAESEEIWREIVRQGPALADAHRLLGAALSHQKRLLEALACYRRAAELAPDDAPTAQTYGGALMEAGYSGHGLRWLSRAALLDPHAVPLKRVMAGALLALGCIADAWGYHAVRSGAAQLRADHHAWDPDETPVPLLAGTHVCIVTEQGLGDELFFFRYAPAVAQVADRVTYRASPRLCSVLRRAAGAERLHEDSAESPKPDIYVLAGDLPLVLGHANHDPRPAPGSHPAQSGLPDRPRRISVFWPALPPPLRIAPLAQGVTDMRNRLAAAGPPPYIGVTWRGGIAPEDQRGATWALFKSIAVGDLAKALHGLSGTVISLQRLPEKGETDALAAALGRPVHDFAAVNDDLEGMLALLSLLDEYVGVSNTNMHLRAAAGKTARVLVPMPAEWRWMQSGRASPWFPGFAIYRQSFQGDWTAALSALKRDLESQLGLS